MKIFWLVFQILICLLAFYGAVQLKKNIFPTIKKDASDIGNKLEN